MKTIALFVHQPYCSVQSDNGIMDALASNYRFKIFTKHEVENDFFDDVEVLTVPGGIGDASTFDMCFKSNKSRIRKFLRNGGKYLGICMGGYWAGSEYFNILHDVNTVQYITRPNTDTRRPHAKNLEVIWEGQKEKMFFYDGFAAVGDESKFETVARYMNGDPMAIIQNNVGIIGCHPESEPHWYETYSWMRGKYHNGNHHKLLLNFVEKLTRNNNDKEDK